MSAASQLVDFTPASQHSGEATAPQFRRGLLQNHSQLGQHDCQHGSLHGSHLLPAGSESVVSEPLDQFEDYCPVPLPVVVIASPVPDRRL